MICQLGFKIFSNPLRHLHGGQIAASSLWPTPFKHNWQSCTAILIQLRLWPAPWLTMRHGAAVITLGNHAFSSFITFPAASSTSLPIPALVLTHPFPSLHRWWPLITFQITGVFVYWSANNFNVKGALFFSSSSFFESTASKIKKISARAGGFRWAALLRRQHGIGWEAFFRSACLRRNGVWGARWIWMRTMKRATQKG